jgi:hypothetical protein
MRKPPAPIPWPLSSFPGANPQEAAGRLVNCYAEPLGEASKLTAAAPNAWRRSPGLSQLAATGQSGYRGGLIVNNLSYEVYLNEALTVTSTGTVTVLGTLSGTKKVSIARNQASNPDVLAVDLDNGAYILNTSALVNATATVTIGGSSFVSGDTVSLLFSNGSCVGFPVTVVYTLGGGSSATIIATGLTSLINANTTLSTAGLTATSAGAVITVKQAGAIGNATTMFPGITGTGSETVTMSPASGTLTGGTGTQGITFTGVPLAYNGVGVLPQPDAVCFQDGYFFLTTGNGQCFATALNSLSVNALTFINTLSVSDVTLLRPIPFNGYLFLFTTGNCEIWQDAANPAPNFPYNRMLVLPYGLIQANAIAGFETGFQDLMWVAQDFGVYRLQWGQLQPQRVSPPDLERLIETQIVAGNTLEASCYMFGGKKFWALSCPVGTWEFNLGTQRWNERFSLQTNGSYGRWRATGGHPAFGRWLMGDAQSGNLLYVDDANYTENGAPQLFRIESGPVEQFPNQLRIARADFDLVMGTGIAERNLQMTVSGAVAGTAGVVRLTVNNTAGVITGDYATISGIVGTTEANGTFVLTVVDASHLEIPVTFVHAYTSGGIVADLTSAPYAINPSVAISISKDGGTMWGNPLIRALGLQGKVKRQRASVKNLGQSGPMGCRWRVDVTDPVYTSLLKATMSSDPREY